MTRAEARDIASKNLEELFCACDENGVSDGLLWTGSECVEGIDSMSDEEWNGAELKSAE